MNTALTTTGERQPPAPLQPPTPDQLAADPGLAADCTRQEHFYWLAALLLAAAAIFH